MNGLFDETRHVIFLGKFENNERYKKQIVQEIIAAIGALLNSNGGKVVIGFETEGNETPVGGSPFTRLSLVIRILEQSIISIIGIHQFISSMDFTNDKESIMILVKKVDSLITVNYNLCLPSQEQVVNVSALEPIEKVNDDIINRKVILEPVQTGSHCQMFSRDSIFRIRESKTVQLKHLKAQARNHTTLADRIVGKGNKFTNYVSAFANYSGGHIYYGINDHGLVIGELIKIEQDKKEITKKVEKAIEKMIWPKDVGQPKRGEQWDIFFEPVVDEDNKPIPSTFVIVIYIAACLGGVFTEEPECYEMRKGKVTRMSLATWKERMSQPWSFILNEIMPIDQRIKWTSAEALQSFAKGNEMLGKLISNGHWSSIRMAISRIRGKHSESLETALLILSKQITAGYCKAQFKKAHKYLEEYNKILPQARDRKIFEVLKFYLEAAVKRASGDLKALKEPLKEALSRAEEIEPGLVPAIVYLFAATVADLIYTEAPESLPDLFSRRALEHLHYIEKDYPNICSDMKQKAHMNLAMVHLGCNMNGQRIKTDIDVQKLKNAKASITAANESTYLSSPGSKYRQCQFNLVLSIYNYRQSQFNPDKKVRYLSNAFRYAEDSERLARELKFMEIVEWSQTHKAACVEALVRNKFKNE